MCVFLTIREDEMDKIISLKLDVQFRKLYKKGVSSVRPTLVLYSRRNGLDCCRLGITTSKKIGNAVVRNRARRRLREIYRFYFDDLRQGYDFIIVARAKTAVVPFEEIKKDFLRAAQDVGVLANA